MNFGQSSSSESQLSKFKSAGNCLPGVLRRLPCFHGQTSHHHIKDMTEPLFAKTNPGVVAKLMGLDSIPQRIPLVPHQQNHGSLNTRGQTPMVLEIKKGKFFVLGFETRCKGKGVSRPVDSKRKLAEDDETKKKKRVISTLNSSGLSGVLLNESENVDIELGFLDQLVLELVYVF